MKTLVERIYEAIRIVAEEKTNLEKRGFMQLWQLKNGKASISAWDLERINEFIKREKSLGYNEDDISVKAWCSTHYEWFSYIAATLKNDKSGSYYQFSNPVSFLSKNKLTKSELEESQAQIIKIISENREIFFNNKENSIQFIEEGLFYQNNLDKMMFDQETHDYVLSVKESIENEKKAAIEAGRTELCTWAKVNGSELLKLRIKHNQNWLRLAEEQWALAHTTGFDVWSDDDESDEWLVKNASIEQLQELEKAVAENPGHEIDMIRSKFMYEESVWNGDEMEDYYHKTFLRITVKTPVGTTQLFKEIQDADDDE